jgi:hypothetical protein
MKKILLVASVLTLISTSALASQARLLALGMKETDNDGSYYISDSRNIFLNPAYVNVYNNYAVAEYGAFGFNATISQATGTTIGTTVEKIENPKAQGGFFKKAGDFVYGLYLGNESNTSSLLRSAGTSAIATIDGATSNTTFAGTNSKMLRSTDNQIDLFLGGDNGLKWGANLVYANGKDTGRDAKDSALATRFGVMGSNWDAHVNLSLANKSSASEIITSTGFGIAATTVNQEFKGKLGIMTGGSYVLSGNHRLYGYVKHFAWEQTDSFNSYTGLSALGGQNGTVKGAFTTYQLGYGSHFEANTTDKVFTSVYIKKTDIDLKFNSKAEVKNLIVPVTIGYEAKATDWLTLRGSIIHNLYGQKDNGGSGSINPVARSLITQTYGTDGKSTITNSTEVNAGASLTFGALVVDGLIGMTDSAGAFSTTAATTSKKGVLSWNKLATKAAVTYTF